MWWPIIVLTVAYFSFGFMFALPISNEVRDRLEEHNFPAVLIKKKVRADFWLFFFTWPIQLIRFGWWWLRHGRE